MFKKFLPVLISAFFLINITAAYGAGILPEATGQIQTYENGSSNCPSGDRNECGLYAVDDFIVLALKISQWILGIVGSLSLAMFIYGGFMFLISAGSAERVTSGKKIITAAIVGLVIVFSSYLIIKFVMGSMGLSWKGEVARPGVVSSTPANPQN